MISRRERHGFAVAVLCGLLIFAPFYGHPADAEALDVQAFWQSPSESAALAVIREAFRERGGVWVDFPTENFDENRRLAFQRIIEGIPPFALQWHAGRELRTMSESGAILELTDLADDMEWSQFLEDDVLGFLGDEGAVFAVPVGIHGENWAWFNSSLLHRYTDSVPETWDDLAALLARAQSDGIPRIAMGPQAWQRRALFAHILIGEGGAGAHRKIMESGEPGLVDEPIVRRALSIFADLRVHDSRNPSVRSWKDGIRAVAHGDALVQFMGDWARAEPAELGLQPGRDFECALSIGPHKHHLSIIDTFVFPRRDYKGLTGQHRTLAEVLLEPKTQSAFSTAKWAIPVRTGLARHVSDSCLREGDKLYRKTNGSVPSPIMIGQERVVSAVETALSVFWDTGSATAEDGAEMLRAALAAGHPPGQDPN